MNPPITSTAIFTGFVIGVPAFSAAALICITFLFGVLVGKRKKSERKEKNKETRKDT
jgi:hypothetical protein